LTKKRTERKNNKKGSVEKNVLANNFKWNKRKGIGIEIAHGCMSTSGLAGKISEVGVESVTFPA
jgi:hypothetical protein